MAADSAVLWTPSAERVAACQLTAFRAAVAAKHGLELPDYAALHAWSLAQREEFWREVWALGKVLGHGPLDRVLVNDVLPGAKWFPDTRLNYAENCLRRRDVAVPAIISSVEGADRREISWGQLYSQVARLSAWLRGHGVGPGVRCAAYTSNTPEAVVAMLAVTSLGGVWSSCSPDFGATAVLDRLGQVSTPVETHGLSLCASLSVCASLSASLCLRLSLSLCLSVCLCVALYTFPTEQVEPEVLFVCGAYTYKGKSFDRT